MRITIIVLCALLALCLIYLSIVCGLFMVRYMLEREVLPSLTFFLLGMVCLGLSGFICVIICEIWKLG